MYAMDRKMNDALPKTTPKAWTMDIGSIFIISILYSRLLYIYDAYVYTRVTLVMAVKSVIACGYLLDIGKIVRRPS